MKSRVLALLLALTAAGAGCWDQRIVDEMEFIAATGFDVHPGGKILFTAVTPSLMTGGRPQAVLYSAVTDNVRQARERLRLQSNGRLEAGKLEQIVFGEAIARRGILDCLDIFVRDPFNPLLAHMAVTKGTARQFHAQSVKWKKIGLPSIYLRRLVSQAEAIGDIPAVNINTFLTAYYAPGFDPVLPLLKPAGNRAVIMGSALFRDDRMAGELNADETYLLTVLQGRSTLHTQSLPIPPDLARRQGRMALLLSDGKAKADLKLAADGPEVAYDLSFQALLEEFHLGYPLTDKVLARIEASAARALERQLESIWDKLRRANSDPVGLGNQVRARYNEFWSAHDWRAVFPRVKAVFRVRVKILNYGVMR